MIIIYIYTHIYIYVYLNNHTASSRYQKRHHLGPRHRQNGAAQRHLGLLGRDAAWQRSSQKIRSSSVGDQNPLDHVVL